MIIRGVKCDMCTWTYKHDMTLDELKEWVGVSCPQCGKCVIITQDEYDIAVKLARWQDRLLKIAKFLHLKPRGGVRIDIGPLRWNEKPTIEKFEITDDDLRKGWYKEKDQ